MAVMRSRTVVPLIVGAAVLAVLLALAFRQRASAPDSSRTSPTGTAPPESSPRPGVRPAIVSGGADWQTGTIEEAWAALRSVEARLLSDEDPDLWLDDLVALDKAIYFLPYRDLAIFIRTARERIDTKVADWLLPVLYVTVGRAGRAEFGQIEELLGERIATESPRTLWGVVAGLSTSGFKGAFSEEEEKKFWLHASFRRPLVREPSYIDRYLARNGYVGYIPKDISYMLIPGLSTPGTGRAFFSPYLSSLLDRVESIPKGELLNERAISWMLPEEGFQEMSERAAKWAADKAMHSSFRVWAIEDLGRNNLDQALALARERIVQGDEDPEFRRGMVDWLQGRSTSGTMYVQSPDILLFDAYYAQKDNGSLMPRLIYYIVSRPQPEAVRIAQDVLATVRDEESHLNVLNGLKQSGWGDSSKNGYLGSEWQSLLIAVSQSPYEKVRQEAAYALSSRIQQGELPDAQAVSARLAQMAKEDPSESVRKSAEIELRSLSKSGK